MIGEILVFVIEAVVNVADIFLEPFASKTLGWIGACTAMVLTWGRADWEIDEWRSIILGSAVCLTGLGLLAAFWIHMSEPSPG